MIKKYFTEKQVNISAILGGPIPPGLLIFMNYKSFGKEKQALQTLIVTLLFTVVFFYLLFQIPEAILDRIPNIVFTAFYAILVYVFFKNYMAKDIEFALEGGGEKRSNWTVAGVTLLGLILNASIVFGMASYLPYYGGDLLEINGNELYYDSEQITLAEVNTLTDRLIAVDFFGKDYGNIAKLERPEDIYIITLLVDEEYWDSEYVTEILVPLKEELSFSSESEIVLESATLSGDSNFKKL